MAHKKDIAIKVEHLSKSFRIPLERSSGLKQKLINSLKGRKGYRVFTPLEDISFEIEKGDFFGIVGRNGSGKSTLLKTIAGIYTPTAGQVHVDGKLIPFIELGVGFNAELSGRENVFLNGALLGFSHSEMEDMYDDIVEFAELEDFMEERLKNYSSGMQVRLAFSIAIRAKGDILLLDEVLAVGDESFQRKCYEYFNELKKDKKTVILVTHSMSAVESFCTKALFIESGKIKEIGNTHEVTAAYSKANNKKDLKKSTIVADQENNIDDIRAETFDLNGLETTTFTAGDDIIINLEWDYKSVKNAGIAVIKSDGKLIYATNTFIENKAFINMKKISYRLNLNVEEGEYFIKVGLFGEHDKVRLAFNDNAAKFTVNRNERDYRWLGITKLKHEWIIENV